MAALSAKWSLQSSGFYQGSRSDALIFTIPVKQQLGDTNLSLSQKTNNRISSVAVKGLAVESEHQEQLDDTARKALRERLSRVTCNAQKLKSGYSLYRPRFTLGIDFGDVRTGVAISKGFAPRPLEVVALKGQKLESRLIEIADREVQGAIEFVVGLPKSCNGLETPQSSKVRCFAGRLAVLAAQRGWCVYLHDEYGSSADALDYMLQMGSTRKMRQVQLDAYAAVVLLQTYFDNAGEYAELVVPKKASLQKRICENLKIIDLDEDDLE